MLTPLDDEMTKGDGMITIETQGTAVSAGDVKVGDEFACVESEKRSDPRRTLKVKAIRCGQPPTAVCDSAREGMATIKTSIALYRLINPTKFRLFARPVTITAGPC